LPTKYDWTFQRHADISHAYAHFTQVCSPTTRRSYAGDQTSASNRKLLSLSRASMSQPWPSVQRPSARTIEASNSIKIGTHSIAVRKRKVEGRHSKPRRLVLIDLTDGNHSRSRWRACADSSTSQSNPTWYVKWPRAKRGSRTSRVMSALDFRSSFASCIVTETGT
jgi:hypothetical protein